MALYSCYAYYTYRVFLWRDSTVLFMMFCIDRYIQKPIHGKFYSPATTFTLVIAICVLWQCRILTLQPLVGFSCPLYLAAISDDKIVNGGK